MKQLRKVSKVEKIVFPVFVVLFCSLLLPSVAPLLGMLMLGNLLRESGVTERLSDTAQNALCNIVTIMLGTTVGATANGEIFLRVQTTRYRLHGSSCIRIRYQSEVFSLVRCCAL